VDQVVSRQLTLVLARAGLRSEVGAAVRLPSASNPVYQVDAVVARLPSRARVGVDRSVEVTNMRRANEVGLAPRVLAWDPDGSLVTELLAGEALRPVDGARCISEVAGLFRRLHRSPAFAGRHDPWGMSAELAAVGATDAGCDRLAGALEAVRFEPMAAAPCHGDPWPGNIVESNGQCRLVDWEYSGMGDPLWDLADFAVECDLDDDDEARFASEYFGRLPDARTMRSIRIYRSLADLVWARWSLAEHRSGNVADDFASEARRRSERGLAAVERL
jgi:hypothetical protein